ncbi:MAG: AAA family ATPase, partial [Myroides sp.]|nr:AAA family ATPase [Myroides sp.]
IIIDSISHEWQGKGGCLEIHEMLGGRFNDWAKVTPRHNAFLDAIIQSKSHVITTSRRKVDYSIDQDSNGKTKVTKVGMKEITREGYEYELTVNFEFLNDRNLVNASKDRTGLFMGKPEFVINSATGKKLSEWCKQGKSLDQIKHEVYQATNEDELKQLYNKYIDFRKDIYEDVLKRKSELDFTPNQIISDNIINI